jgi:hypothetical protein
MSADRGGEDDAEIIIPNTPHECAKMICARGRGRRRNDFHTVEREHFHKMLLSAHSDHGGNDLGVINCNQFKNTIFPQADPLLYCKEDVPYLSEEEKNGAREALENQKKLENEYLEREQKAKEAKAKAKAKTDKSINRKGLNKGNAEKAAKRAEQAAADDHTSGASMEVNEATLQSIKRRNQERIFAEEEAERQANATTENCFNALCEITGDGNITNKYFQKNRNKVDECRLVGALGKFAEMKCPAARLADDFFDLLLLDVKQ